MTSHPHGPDELCAAGSDLYARALREGHVPSEDAARAPCLLDLGLLHAEADGARLLRPIAVAVAVTRLRAAVHERIAEERRRSTRLVAAFEPLMALADRAPQPQDSAVIVPLAGVARIQDAVSRALADTRREMLSIQPGGVRSPAALSQSLPDARAAIARGGRMRTLYQHTSRHSLPVLAYHEQLEGDTEVRTLDEVPERLFVFDRTVAFIPANSDRTTALEIRHPALVEYFATAFDRLWRLAVPMYPRTTRLPSENGITTRQRAVAGLLVEGLTDTEIAARLGMNVRTARLHVAKLGATLGSHSRAQLGFLIGRSGVLDQRGPEDESGTT
ncbi:LuxR C-terminal-related transcriptional regulator [Streptomyces sp. NPDC087300]|uniref:helix-turn-helix transcriptional regulator n=1 Tax=Streptomyces sp. NPDC087300 TaxID=3365780 RepID=UPI003830D3C8